MTSCINIAKTTGRSKSTIIPEKSLLITIGNHQRTNKYIKNTIFNYSVKKAVSKLMKQSTVAEKINTCYINVTIKTIYKMSLKEKHKYLQFFFRLSTWTWKMCACFAPWLFDHLTFQAPSSGQNVKTTSKPLIVITVTAYKDQKAWNRIIPIQRLFK